MEFLFPAPKSVSSDQGLGPPGEEQLNGIYSRVLQCCLSLLGLFYNYELWRVTNVEEESGKACVTCSGPTSIELEGDRLQSDERKLSYVHCYA